MVGKPKPTHGRWSSHNNAVLLLLPVGIVHSFPENTSAALIVLRPVDPRDVVSKTRLECPRQTSHREDRHIVRNARVQPTDSSTAIQAQVAPSLGAPMSSQTIRRRLAEEHLRSRSPLLVLPLAPTHRRLRLEWCRARGNWTAAEWNQVIFSDESRFNLSSDDHCVGVWRPHGECLNPTFVLQRHTAPTAGAMIWGVIAYNARLPLVLIRGTKTAQRFVHDILQPHVLPLMQLVPRQWRNGEHLGPLRQSGFGPPRCGGVRYATAPRSHFSTRQCSSSRGKDLTRLSLHCYYLSLACLISRFVSNRACLRSLGTASWTFHEFERTRSKVTVNMERNVSRHYTELICLNARSYRIVHSR
ncbi:transposable element Tcb1 transposase [Trichonephila clavipes]|nr:transposable element Tcb1 transposase [Trichonephila clavipes]